MKVHIDGKNLANKIPVINNNDIKIYSNSFSLNFSRFGFTKDEVGLSIDNIRCNLILAYCIFNKFFIIH